MAALFRLADTSGAGRGKIGDNSKGGGKGGKGLKGGGAAKPDSGDGFLDFGEVRCLVRGALAIGPDQLSEGDLRDIWKVTAPDELARALAGCSALRH